MGVGEPLGGLTDVVGGLSHLERTLLLHHALKVLALHVLHHHVVAVALARHVVGMDDVRMIEGGDRPRLGEEPLQGGRVLAQLPGDALQGHGPVHHGVPGQEHAAHAAPAQEIHQLVLAPEEVRAPGEQLPGLPAREHLLADQGPSQGAGVGGLAGNLAGHGELVPA